MNQAKITQLVELLQRHGIKAIYVDTTSEAREIGRASCRERV